MRYFELIAQRPLVWSLFLIYMVATGWLAWRGHKKTTDIQSFAVGSGDLSPVVVGITLAASIASTATFVINPGFVYVHGLSAFAHLNITTKTNIITKLYVMSSGFRRIGAGRCHGQRRKCGGQEQGADHRHYLSEPLRGHFVLRRI